MTARSLLDRTGALLRPRAGRGDLRHARRPRSSSRPANLELMARQTAIVCMAALGMTIVIATGGIDLSVGSMIALTTVVIALVLRAGHAPLAAAARRRRPRRRSAACVNGVLITRLKVVPFIVTLGTMLIVRGAAKGLAEERRIEAPITWLNDLLRTPARRALPAGRDLGGHRRSRSSSPACCATRGSAGTCSPSARTSGWRGCAASRSRGPRSLVYTMSAALVGMAGLLQFSKLSVGDPTVGGRARARRHRRGDHRRRQPDRRPRHGRRHDHRRRDHDDHPDRLLAEGARQLGAADRHRRHHRRGGRARPRAIGKASD